jgi:tetratricopeptide (TPR) repeat protein
MAGNRHSRLLCALMVLALASSLSGAQAITTTQDRALAKLQAQLSRDPNNFKALRAVGVKLFELKRFPEARPLLEQAYRLRPTDGTSALYAGMVAEELKDLPAARRAYQQYLSVGKSRSGKRDIQARIFAISAEELKQSAAAAVANEQALRGQTVDGKTVAVLPFRCNCTDTFKPLERGLAELVVTDLSISKQLRVLERDRMQAISDEIRLSATAAVDATTATRAGKLIQAGTIVNGSINIQNDRDLQISSALVNTTNGAILPGSPAASGLLNALFDAEKEIVRETFDALGIRLLASEEALFRTRPTQNLNAFLAFSRGLIAQDAGRTDEAIALFESARSQDPGFSAAIQRANQAASARAGAQVSSTTVQQSIRNSAEGQVVAAASSGTTVELAANNVLANVVADVNPTTTNTVQTNTGGGTTTAPPQTQNTVSQATGGDQPAQKTGQVTIVIRRP